MDAAASADRYEAQVLYVDEKFFSLARVGHRWQHGWRPAADHVPAGVSGSGEQGHLVASRLGARSMVLPDVHGHLRSSGVPPHLRGFKRKRDAVDIAD